MIRVIFLSFVLAWGVLTSAQAGNQPLRVGYQTAEVNVLLTYAVGSGLFERHGLDVRLAPFPAGPAMLPALAADQIDLGWMGEFPSVTGYANGLPIEILMMERLDFTNIRLVARPELGATSLTDLRGKRVAATVGSSSHYHLLQALTQAGMRQSDITLVNLAPANMPAAYAAGQIDAAFTWEPNIGIIEAEGATVIATTESLGMITGGVWVAQQALAREREDTLLAFLTAWREAQSDYLEDPVSVQRFEAERIGQTSEEFAALVARMSVTNPGFEALLSADFMGAPGEELDSRLMRHLQGIGEFLVAQERIDRTPDDWRGLFNTLPIQRVLSDD